MDISYKTILEILYTGNNSDNSFPSKKSIMISSDTFPKKFSELFSSSDKISRFGVSTENKDNKNISFFTSILSLLNTKFISEDRYEELNSVNNFIESIKDKVKDKKFKFELDLKFAKQIILDRINSLNFEDGILIQVISQILDVNFLILDFKDEKLYTIFNGDFLNPWKATLLLGKKESNWEPILSDKKLFSYNDNFLKDILSKNEVNYYNDNFLEKSFTLLDNINEIENCNLSYESSEEDCDNFINPISELKSMNLNKTKLKNMKKDDLIEIVTKLNLNISASINKNNMIDKILPYLN